jgi:hypothetical protein
MKKLIFICLLFLDSLCSLSAYAYSETGIDGMWHDVLSNMPYVVAETTILTPEGYERMQPFACKISPHDGFVDITQENVNYKWHKTMYMVDRETDMDIYFPDDNAVSSTTRTITFVPHNPRWQFSIMCWHIHDARDFEDTIKNMVIR